MRRIWKITRSSSDSTLSFLPLKKASEGEGDLPEGTGSVSGRAPDGPQDPRSLTSQARLLAPSSHSLRGQGQNVTVQGRRAQVLESDLSLLRI